MICVGVYVILVIEYKGGVMMEALYNLYNNDYFGIGLFIVVTILAFSFLIILFFGKKDEKNKNAEQNEQKEIEETKIDSLSSMSLENTNLMSDNIETKTDEEKEINLEESNNNLLQEDINPFLDTNLMMDEEVKSDVSEKVEDIKEPDSIKIEESDFDPFANNDIAPVIEKEEVPSIFANETEELPKPKVNFSNQFSSVYVNQKKEDNVVNEVVEDKTENVLEEQTIKPVKPAFELPKSLDLPKLNKSETTNDSIIKPVQDSSSNIDSIINSLEDESFTIEKE